MLNMSPLSQHGHHGNRFAEDAAFYYKAELQNTSRCCLKYNVSFKLTNNHKPCVNLITKYAGYKLYIHF